LDTTIKFTTFGEKTRDHEYVLFGVITHKKTEIKDMTKRFKKMTLIKLLVK